MSAMSYPHPWMGWAWRGCYWPQAQDIDDHQRLGLVKADIMIQVCLTSALHLANVADRPSQSVTTGRTDAGHHRFHVHYPIHLYLLHFHAHRVLWSAQREFFNVMHSLGSRFSAVQLMRSCPMGTRSPSCPPCASLRSVYGARGLASSYQAIAASDG